MERWEAAVIAGGTVWIVILFFIYCCMVCSVRCLSSCKESKPTRPQTIAERFQRFFIHLTHFLVFIPFATMFIIFWPILYLLGIDTKGYLYAFIPEEQNREILSIEVVGNCRVCLNAYPTNTMVQCTRCSCTTCPSCFSNHVDSQLEEGVTRIRCANCSTEVPIPVLGVYMSPAALERYTKRH